MLKIFSVPEMDEGKRRTGDLKVPEEAGFWIRASEEAAFQLLHGLAGDPLQPVRKQTLPIFGEHPGLHETS